MLRKVHQGIADWQAELLLFEELAKLRRNGRKFVAINSSAVVKRCPARTARANVSMLGKQLLELLEALVAAIRGVGSREQIHR